MTSEFEERLRGNEREEQLNMALGDYDMLGEDLALIKALGDQLALYSDIISINGSYKVDMHIEIPIDTLWGLGTMITRVAHQMKDKINILDEKYDLSKRRMCATE